MALLLLPGIAAAQEAAQRLIAASQAFRITAALDIERVNAGFAPPPAQPFDSRLLTRQRVPVQVIWRYFLLNTQAAYGALESEQPFVGFYNPLLDFWLLTEWQLPAGIPVLERAYLLPGATFDNPAIAAADLARGLPRWVAAAGQMPPGEALASQGRSAIQNFLRLIPPDSRSRPASLRPENGEPILRAFSARLDLFIGGLAELRQDGILFEQQTRQRQLLENASAAELLRFFGNRGGAEAAQALTELPLDWRAGLQVDAMLRLRGADIVVSSRDDDGRWYLVTRFDRPDGVAGPALPRSMLFVDATGDGLP